MAKILAVGDIHVKKNNIPEIRAFKEALLKTVSSTKAEYVVFLGDMANDHSTMHLQAWQEIVSLIDDTRKVAKVIYVVGNHDMLNNSVYLEDDHFFNIFKTMDSVKVIDKPTSLRLGDDIFGFLPYVSPGRFKEAFSGLDNKDSLSALFCHQEFLGCSMGHIESKSPDVWEAGMPLVISGHIHDKQELFNGNVVYIGTPYQTGYAEGSDKTISLFEFPNRDRTDIDLGLPKKKTLNMTVEKLLSFNPNDDVMYRINIVDDIDNILKFKKTKEYVSLREKFKLVPKPIDKVYIKNERTSGITFFDAFKKSIEDEENLKPLYEEVLEEYSRETK